MSETPIKDQLVAFVLSFSVGAILLHELPPTKKLNRTIATALATADVIKSKIEEADEITLKAMVIGSRRNLEQVRQAVNLGAFPISASKARREWLEAAKKLLKETAGINA